MAITATHYEILRKLPVRRGSSLLEIGEANWYGDLDPVSVGLLNHPSLFEVAKDFYSQWFEPSRITAIDAGGTSAALRLDLNGPIDLHERFDVVINHGTLEHVLNVVEALKTIHDHCELNGWMIHDAPCQGWVDHGFYCFQPTLFYDLAAANRYEVSRVAIHEPRSRAIIEITDRHHVSRLAKSGDLPAESLIVVAFRKRVNAPFVIPFQGYYSGTLSPQGRQAWEGR